jgi:hypothetical protein
MDRRALLGFFSLSACNLLQPEAWAELTNSTVPRKDVDRSRRITLLPTGPVSSIRHGQLIEGLDILAEFGPGLVVLHQDVTVRNCRIRHAQGPGLVGRGAHKLQLYDCEIDHIGAPTSGPLNSPEYNNISLDRCRSAVLRRIKASRGSANIYAASCPEVRLTDVELHDARGPEPRGQNVQFDNCPRAALEYFSCENGATSWTEDNVSVFHSDNCSIRHGHVFYNNSPTGDGVMLEGSFDCTVEDVDALQQGNGAFAAVPEGARGSGGCTFERCRTRDSYNAVRDGREKPSSNGLSFYLKISSQAKKHRVVDCQFDHLANPHNLIWKRDAVEPGWVLTQQEFEPISPVRLLFPW